MIQQTKQTKQQLRVRLRDLLTKCNDYRGTTAGDYTVKEITFILHLLDLTGRDATTQREAREYLVSVHRRLYWHLQQNPTAEALPTLLSFFDTTFPENTHYAQLTAYSPSMLDEEAK